ncbi:MAG: DUF6526 family protein [Candidatus Kapaibacterium sp.]
MAASSQQSAESHAQYVPGFHFVTLGLVAINILIVIYRIIVNPTLMETLALIPAVALALVAFYARAFAAANQDRIIRLEERLRLERLLPADLSARIGEIDRSQLIALRFASDAELPELARRVIAERPDSAAIKKMIRTWRPDNIRV